MQDYYTAPPRRSKKGPCPKPIAERFWTKVKSAKPYECWEWRGTRNRNGYGSFTLRDGVTMEAHRMVWLMEIGPLENGVELHHLCSNHACVNPEHLQPVLGIEHRSIYHRQLFCRRGHEMTEENSYWRFRNGSQIRECHTCLLEAKRRYYLRRGLDQKRRWRERGRDLPPDPELSTSYPLVHVIAEMVSFLGRES